jgi:hypothetical protein
MMCLYMLQPQKSEFLDVELCYGIELRERFGEDVGNKVMIYPSLDTVPPFCRVRYAHLPPYQLKSDYYPLFILDFS